MPPLLDLQRSFYKAIFNNDPSLIAPLISNSDTLKERFEIYRDNVFVCLKMVLQDDFPLCQKALGEKLFSKASFEFIRTLPPDQGCLFGYGADFPTFLSLFLPKIPYLKDLATLEWAKKAVCYGVDHTPLVPSDLEGLDPESSKHLRFKFPQPTFFVSCHYDLEAFTRGEPLRKNLCHALIIRSLGGHPVHWLTPDTFTFFKMLFDEMTLDEAWRETLKTYPSFEVSAALAMGLVEGFFTS